MRLVLIYASLTLLAESANAQRVPIVDIHMHAWNVAPAGPEALANQAYFRSVLSAMDSLNVVLGVISGPEDFLDHWTASARGRFLAGPMFPCDQGRTPNQGLQQCFRQGGIWPDTTWLRNQLREGRFKLLGELTNQYAGIRFDDPRMEPYYALAEEYDVPIAVHIGAGPPLTAQGCCPGFRVALGDPLMLENALVKHPRLRVHLMHGSIERVPQLLNLLLQYPQLYVDLSPYGERVLHDELATYKRAGLLGRVMFGTDCRATAGSVCLRRTVDAYRAASFLTPDELDDIFCRNAGRFLRLPQLCTMRK